MKAYIAQLSPLGIALIVLSSLLLSFSYHPPVEQGKLTISGKVKNANNKILDSISIIITDSTGRLALDTIKTDKKGKFKYEFEYNQNYRMHYVAKGYLKSFDLIKTEVPKSKLYKDLYGPTLVVTLFDSTADVNRRAIQRHPFYVIYFDKSLDMFIEDVESVTAYLDEVIKPNVGEMYVSGVFQDTLVDTFRVRILAEDTLGFLLAETQSNEDGSYKISLPLMNKVKLKFVSDNHYESFAMVNTKVKPESNSGNDYVVKQDFTLVNKVDTTVNEDAFDKPIARVEHFEGSDDFVENPAVATRFTNELMVGNRRMQFSGYLTSREGTAFKNTNIQVRDGDVLVEEVVVDSNYFKVDLPYQSIVHVRFKTNDYHDSYVSFNTNMDVDNTDKKNEVKANVELISRDRSDINPKAFQYPMYKYYYSNNDQSFVNDSVTKDYFIAELNTPIEVPDTAVSKNFVTIRGAVIDPSRNGKSVPNARVRILNKDRAMTSSFSTDKKGRYSATLGLNKVYFLEVEADEYFATQIKFDTHVPEGMDGSDLEDHPSTNLEILHSDMEISDEEGNRYRMRQEMLEQNESMAYYFNDTVKEFVEDPAVFDQFALAIIEYKEPVEPEIPAVTLAQIEEAKRLEAEKNKPKQPDMRLAGKVNDERNQPVAGASVALYEGKKKVGEGKTDSAGNFNMGLPVQREMVLKVEGKGLYPVTADINTIYPDSLEPKSEILVLPDLKTYTTSNVGINPAAFDDHWQKITYDPSTNRFVTDDETPKLYAKKLNSTPDNQYLAVEGRAKDQKGRNIGDAQIIVTSNGVVVDTVYSDKKGKYNIKLEYQKDYRMQVIKEGYQSTFAAVSTNTSKEKERLIDKKVKSLNLLLVNKNEKNINNKVFSKPYARIAYDPQLDEFVEVGSITESFIADLFIEEEKPDKKKKKEYQLKSKTVLAKAEFTSEKGYKEYTSSAGAAKEAAQKRSQNQSQAQKSVFMGTFHNAISGIQGERRAKIQDVTLSLNEIFNARVALTGQDKKKIDENMAEAAEQKNDFNDIISSALGMRTDGGDLVSTDSTFNVYLLPRIKHLDQGKKIYSISRDQVYVKGIMTEYVETTDWFVWDNYYKNNKKISESSYRAELDSIKRIGYLLN
ncbi:MAG: hypothetical protein CL840_02165 [Crocinitomicaceae bacterium]|nr:hypothetical protein [Crocinitomicaceae bacterium]|tara:strand:+ start:14830 stop:18210 length:3381 start_codon:yes stop_codon:yes gene_type:complete